MPHLSQQELDTTTRKQIIGTLELVLGKMDRAETKEFLYSLLSETERIMLAKRLASAVLLKEGIDQQAIAESLRITRETVNRIELTLLKKPKGFARAFEKIQNDKLTQALKKGLLQIASYSIKASGGKV